LASATRSAMEHYLGFDFSRVRVHHDASAAVSADAIQARAYTASPNLVFAEGEYRPGTLAGDRLIAHELTHIVQQHFTQETPLSFSSPEDTAEMEATTAATAWGTKSAVHPSQHATAAIQRDKKKGQKTATQTSGKNKVFIHEGFTGRETEEEVRRTALRRGWVIEGSVHWNGKNWIGEDVRPATGQEKAIAEATEVPEKIGEGIESITGDIDLNKGFEEGQKPYVPGEEFEQKRPEQPGRETTRGEGKTAGKSETGKGENPELKKGQNREGEDLDVATSLASLILDPESLARDAPYKKGQTGTPIGSKSGIISGLWAKAAVIILAVLTVAGSHIKKAFKKLAGFAKGTFNSLRNKLLPRSIAPKALPAPKPKLTPDEEAFNKWATEHGLTEADLKELSNIPEGSPSPNQRGTIRIPEWKKPSGRR